MKITLDLDVRTIERLTDLMNAMNVDDDGSYPWTLERVAYVSVVNGLVEMKRTYNVK